VSNLQKIAQVIHDIAEWILDTEPVRDIAVLAFFGIAGSLIVLVLRLIKWLAEWLLERVVIPIVTHFNLIGIAYVILKIVIIVVVVAVSLAPVLAVIVVIAAIILEKLNII
jgi:hypothetical protein